jgi:hypothetical protein
MKKILFILALFAASSAFSIDRFVDPNLGSSNGTTLFTTIATAVNASVNGDRILIVAGTYNEPTLTLSKSLTLLSQTAGTTINYNGNIVISGFEGMKLQILGFNLGIYSVSSNAITGGVASNRAKVSIINCKMTNLSLDNNYYELNTALSTMSGTTTFRFGNFVVSKTNNLYVYDEPNINLTGAKILIAADTITTRLEFRNDDYPALIANCRCANLYFYQWNHITSNTNYIKNNQFLAESKIHFPYNPPAYNIEFSSNEFLGTYYFYTGGGNCAGLAGGYGGADCNGCGQCSGYSSSNSIFPNPDISGFFRWTYNGIDLPCTVPTGAQPLVLTKITGTVGTNINSGNPNHEYYDVDLTVNDRGRTGGPFSILNYVPSINPSGGKANIFDLEIPADLFPGQSIDIKAKGYHKN